MPWVKLILVDTIETSGPFAAKGVREACIIPVAPAIAGADFDSVGRRDFAIVRKSEGWCYVMIK